MDDHVEDEDACGLCNGSGWYEDEDQAEAECPCRHDR